VREALPRSESTMRRAHEVEVDDWVVVRGKRLSVMRSIAHICITGAIFQAYGSITSVYCAFAFTIQCLLLHTFGA